jgi:hypothetical protein
MVTSIGYPLAIEKMIDLIFLSCLSVPDKKKAQKGILKTMADYLTSNPSPLRKQKKTEPSKDILTRKILMGFILAGRKAMWDNCGEYQL